MNQNIYVLIEHFNGKVNDISYSLLAQAQLLTKATGGQVIGILLGSQAQELAQDINADKLLYYDNPALATYNLDTYKIVLTDLLSKEQPRVFLFGDTTIGAEVSSCLSAHLNLPIISNCTFISEDLDYHCNICGGKIQVEGKLPEESTIAALLPGIFKIEEGKSPQAPTIENIPAPSFDGIRITFNQFIEPETEDVDITKENVLIAVGRGIEREDNIEMAEELAEALGGAVCGSRPVIDQNWLPTSRLIGKSGKIVKPHLYIALGISGAPEHTEGITNSDLIIAINTDPAAPIFNIAKYGAEIDMLDLLPDLVEKINEAKGG